MYDDTKSFASLVIFLIVIAQSVSNMPSPRVTRGRKKLFNADAAPKAEPKWSKLCEICFSLLNFKCST